MFIGTCIGISEQSQATVSPHKQTKPGDVAMYVFVLHACVCDVENFSR